MIFFLINNNYHLYDVKLHLTEMSQAGIKIGLIQIPHTLEPINFHENIDNIYLFHTPFIDSKSFWNPLNVFSTHRLIEDKLIITENDILLMYTEEEFLNQFILMKFKKQKAKVFLLDEGVQSMMAYSNLSYTGYPVKLLIKLFYLRYIIGYKSLRVNYLAGYGHPQLQDEFIDGILCYYPFQIQRHIKKINLKKSVEIMHNLNEQEIIFLSQPLYEDNIISYEEYVCMVDSILNTLSNQFENIYFKFHPREKNTKFLEEHILNKYTKVIIIQEKLAVEELISYYKPKYAISFDSVSLLNLNYLGLISIYCFKDFDILLKSDEFIMMEKALRLINYIFPENLTKITSSTCGFKPQEPSNLSLTEYLINGVNFA